MRLLLYVRNDNDLRIFYKQHGKSLKNNQILLKTRKAFYIIRNIGIYVVALMLQLLLLCDLA